MVGNEQFVGRRLDIFGKGRPGFLEAGFAAFAVAVSLLVGDILRPAVVLPAADTGDRDGVDAVVDVVRALLAGILLLQSPHLAERGGRGTLDRIDSVKNRLQIEPCIFADDADVDSLPIAESFGNLGHGEAFVFPAPVVELHLQIVAALNGVVLFGFNRCAFAPANLGFNLLLQTLHFFPPAKRFDPLHDLDMIGQLGRQFRPFCLPVESIFAERLVHLRVIAAASLRERVLDVEIRSRPDEVRNADLPPGIGTDVLLFFPQPVFQHFVVRGFYLAAGFGGILAVDLFGIFPILNLPFPLILLDGLPPVRIIESAGEFNPDLRVSVDPAFA